MCDQWMPTIELPLTNEQFHQLPRNPAYKYEYLGDKAYLTPRARHYHAVLDLERRPVSEDVETRQLQSDELAELVPLVCGAFRSIQPYGSLNEATREQAARQAMERTRTGGDGPLIEQASFVAIDKEKLPSTRIGAILITLLPAGDPSEVDNYYWRDTPPPQRLSHTHRPRQPSSLSVSL